MKTFLQSIMALVAFSCALNAWAATLTAEFKPKQDEEGNWSFAEVGTTSGLTITGGTLSATDGTLSIASDATAGVTIANINGTNGYQNVSVEMVYSLDAGAVATGALLTVANNNTTPNYYGIVRTSATKLANKYLSGTETTLHADDYGSAEIAPPAVGVKRAATLVVDARNKTSSYINGNVKTFSSGSLKWSNKNILSITLGAMGNGSFVYSGLRIHRIRVWTTQLIDEATIIASAKEELARVVTRTVSGSGNTWNTASAWSDETLPSDGDSTTLTVSGGTSLMMDVSANLDILTITADATAENDPDALTFTGTGDLSAASSAINADTDVSGITGEVNLGAVALATGKTLTVDSPNQYASISRANGSILHVKGAVSDTSLMQNNTTLKTSGTTTIKGDLLFNGANRTWIFGKEENTASTATVSGRLVLAAESGANSYLTVQDGATLTIESNNKTMGISGLDGAAFLGNYGATVKVLIKGEGSQFNVPNGAVNLARDGSPTIEVKDGALFSAYRMNGDTNTGHPNMTVENAEFRLGKADTTDSQLKIVESTLTFRNATLSANSDWAVTTDTTAGKIIFDGAVTVKPTGHTITLRKLSGAGEIVVEGSGSVVFAGDIATTGGLALREGASVDIGTWHPTLNALGANCTLTLSADADATTILLPVVSTVMSVPEGFRVVVTEWGSDVEPELSIQNDHLMISKPIETRVWKPTVIDDLGTVSWSDGWSGSEDVSIARLDYSGLTGNAAVTIPAGTTFTSTELRGGDHTLTVTLESGAALGDLTVVGNVIFKSVGFGDIFIAKDCMVTIDPDTDLIYTNTISGEGALAIASGVVTLSGENDYSGGTMIASDAILKVESLANIGGSGASAQIDGCLVFVGKKNNPGDDLSQLKGYGTVRFEVTTTSDDSWRTLPRDDAHWLPTTLKLENCVEKGLIVPAESDGVIVTLGTFSGTKPLRVDYDTNSRIIKLVQSSPATHTGNLIYNAATDRLTKIIVAGADGVTGDTTLTLDGTGTSVTKLLEIESSGSVQLNQLWQGDVTVAGRLGAASSSGTIDGELTFNAGAVLDVSTGTLTANSTVTVNGTLTVVLASVPTAKTKILSATAHGLTGSVTAQIKVGDVLQDGWAVTACADGLYVEDLVNVGSTTTLEDAAVWTSVWTVNGREPLAGEKVCLNLSDDTTLDMGGATVSVGKLVVQKAEDANIETPSLTIINGSLTPTSELLLEDANITLAGSTDAVLPTVLSYPIKGTGGVNVGSGFVKLTSANTYAGGTFVDAGATLEITNREALGSAAVTGCGTVVYDGDAALPNAPTWFATGTVSTGWRGTVLIKNVPDDNPDTELVFERYGNAHSTVELTDVCGYLGTQSFEGTLKLTDESASVPALKIVNGWTDTNNPRVITVQRLAGDGTFQGANGTYDYGFVFKDVADFTGSIKLATGNDRGTGVVLGGTDYSHSSYERKIVVANGATLTVPLVLDGALLLPETVSDMLTVRVSGDMPEGGYPVLTNVGSASWTVPGTLTVNTRVVNGTTSMSVAGLKLEVKTANDVAGLYLVQPETPVKIPSAEVLGVIDAAPKPEGVTMIAEVVVQGTGTEALATHSVEAVEVFGNILTVTPTAEGATTGTATIAYDFGIEGITMDTEGNVVLAVKVQNSVTENTAEIINPETTLKVYLNGSDTPLEGIIVNGAGATATITIPAEKVADLKTHTFRVNAEK